MIRHIKVRKRNWLLTILVSILLGLFCCIMFVGVSGIMITFGLAENSIIPPLPYDQIFIIGWIVISVMVFLHYVLESNEFTYEAIEHE